VAAFAQDASTRLGPQFVDERQAVQALERCAAYMHSGDPDAWAGAGEVRVSGRGLGAKMLAAERAWELLIGGDRRTDAVELARFATADGQLLRDEPGLFWVIAGLVLELADEDTAAFWDEALAVAHTRGSLFSVLAAHLWRGYRQWRRGELTEAHQSLQAAIEQTIRWGGTPLVGLAYGEAFLISAMVDRGALREARDSIERTAPRPRLGDGARLYGQAQARLLLAEGRYDQALRILDGHPTTSANPVWFEARSLRARALAGLGRHGEAVALADEDHAQQRRWGAPSLVGRTLRLLGHLRGDPDQLREAAALLAPTGARLEYARALAALARVTPDRAEQVRVRRQALRLAEGCGAARLRAELAQALTEAGVPVPAEPDVAATLTATERRVAAMAVDGADDREIAQALFLTPRSVTDTLASVRQRLGVRFPHELRQALPIA
jgi:ATP/maltotriose-dependent transcriptional regulator MalT